jgi:hypothetical protein
MSRGPMWRLPREQGACEIRSQGALRCSLLRWSVRLGRELPNRVDVETKTADVLDNSRSSLALNLNSFLIVSIPLFAIAFRMLTSEPQD